MTKRDLTEFHEQHFCGCGCPQAAWEFLRDTLALLARRSDENVEQRLGTQRYMENCRLIDLHLHYADAPGMYWTYLYWIDHLGLTEHGGCVSNAWPSPVGRELLAALQEHGCDPDKWEDRDEPEDGV